MYFAICLFAWNLGKIQSNILKYLLQYEYLFLILAIRTIFNCIYHNNSLLPILGFLFLLVAALDAAVGLSFLVRCYTTYTNLGTYTFTKLSI